MALEYNKHHSKRSILTSYLNSVPYGTVGGQTAIGVQAAARDLLRQAGLAAGPRSSRRCSPACRRRPRSTTRSSIPTAASERRNEVLAKMAELHYISRGAGRQRRARAAGGHTAATTTPNAKRTSSSNTCASCSIERYGAKTVEQGGLKVYTTIDLQHAAPGAQSDRRSARRARRPGVGDRHDQPRQRRHRGDGGVRELRAVAVQPRRRRPPPARLDVQGDRPRRRALARDRPEHDLLPTRTRSSRAGWPATRRTK